MNFLRCTGTAIVSIAVAAFISLIVSIGAALGGILATIATVGISIFLVAVGIKASKEEE